MRGCALAAVALAVGWAAGPGWGNDASVEGVGGAVKLMGGHPTVVMRSARVKIDLASERVECEYVFENTGPATKVLVGFPESGWGDASPPKGAKTHFREFRSWVDGEEVQVTPRPAKETNDGYERFWVKEVAFSARQTRVVRNTYLGGGGGDIAGTSFFQYQLSPAASWKGKVGTIEVEMDLTGMGGFSLAGVKPAGHRRSGDTIRWQRSNVEPSPEMDISISYFTGYSDIWVDGRKCDVAEAEMGDTNPYPQVREGALMVRCEDIGKWLGLKFSQNEDGQRVVLAGQGKRLAITEGESTALVDAKKIELRAERLWVTGVPPVFAPLKPVAEAFGGRVRFDPLTKRTYVHTAKALVGARRPQWLERALTEADLRGKSPAELRDMRNGIYAGRGREFQNRELRHRFYCEPWYEPNPKYSDDLLTELDRANLALIRKAEGGQGSGG